MRRKVYSWVAEIEPSHEPGWYPCPLYMCENSEFGTTVKEHIMEYHKPNLNLEQNWTVEDLMKKLRELNISFLPKFRKLYVLY